MLASSNDVTHKAFFKWMGTQYDQWYFMEENTETSLSIIIIIINNNNNKKKWQEENNAVLIKSTGLQTLWLWKHIIYVEHEVPRYDCWINFCFLFTFNTVSQVLQHTSSASSATMARIAFKTRFEPENTKSN